MSSGRRFPVLLDYYERRAFPDCPHDVPWDMLAAHEKQALRNHDQDLETLARRGGLGPSEMVCILRDAHFLTVCDGVNRISDEKERECIDELKRRIAEWEAR